MLMPLLTADCSPAHSLVNAQVREGQKSDLSPAPIGRFEAARKRTLGVPTQTTTTQFRSRVKPQEAKIRNTLHWTRSRSRGFRPRFKSLMPLLFVSASQSSCQALCLATCSEATCDLGTSQAPTAMLIVCGAQSVSSKYPN